MKDFWWCWNVGGDYITVIGMIDDRYTPDVTGSELALIKFLVEDPGHSTVGYNSTRVRLRPLINTLLAAFPL